MDEHESEPQHDAEELARLVRFMTRPGRRFGLGLATYVSPSVGAAMRRSAIEQVREGGTRVGSVEFAALAGDVIGLLAHACEGVDVLFVTHLDPIAYDATEQGLEARVLMHLNLRRDELPDHIDARVVFWLVAEGYPQAAKLAWDLLMVANTRFEFVVEAEAEPEAEAEAEPTRPSWLIPPGEVRAEVLAKQAESFAASAGKSDAEVARAEAAASAGRLFASIDRFGEAIVWLRAAAEGFERLGDRQLDAAEQFRRLGQIARLSGDERLGDWALKRSLSILDTAPPHDATMRQRIETLGELLAGPDTISDDELIARWQSGDLRAGDIFARRHFHLLLSYFRGHGALHASQLAIQTIFQFDKQRNPKSRASDLYKIARALLKEKARPEPVSDGTLAMLAEAFDDPIWRIRSILDDLPIAEGDVIELYYFHQMDIGEIATFLGITAGVVQFRLAAAVRKLTKIYSQHHTDTVDIERVLLDIRNNNPP